MPKLLWVCACLWAGLLIGCGRNAPSGPPATDPPPKTEIIKRPDGSEEIKTSIPTPK